MKKLAGLLVVVALGAGLTASPAAAVDVPSSSSLTAGPLAEATAATGSTAPAATSTPTSPTPATVGECHDAFGNDIPCPGTGGGTGGASPVGISPGTLPPDAQAQVIDAQTQASTAQAQANAAQKEADTTDPTLCFIASNAIISEALDEFRAGHLTAGELRTILVGTSTFLGDCLS
jgi:hypothetical protein